MTPTEQIAEITRLLRSASEQMQAEHGGAPLEWPMVLAGMLHGSLNLVLGASMTQSHLIALLVQADAEQKRLAPGADWPSWYAGWLHERYRHNRPGS